MLTALQSGFKYQRKDHHEFVANVKFMFRTSCGPLALAKKVSAIKPWNHIQNAFKRLVPHAQQIPNADNNILVLIKEATDRKKKCTQHILI